MKHFKTSLLLLTLTATSVAGTGCGLGEGYYDSWDDSSYSSPGSDGDFDEDLILVTHSGETLLIEYNDTVFTALINWEDGNYYFAPDREGTYSGDVIICVASISTDRFQGDCFRDGQVCTFYYAASYYDDDGTDKDIYALASTSCKEAPYVGPFLVPLDAPLCGESPYPDCVDDSLFPAGPDGKTPDGEDGEDAEDSRDSLDDADEDSDSEDSFEDGDEDSDEDSDNDSLEDSGEDSVAVDKFTSRQFQWS
ncbi:MAG: hypothetical protein HYU99_06330 [Deltaproteobacteria bacterium]|nr:hypothetical protein [Deltaproteobacteria bacterium]